MKTGVRVSSCREVWVTKDPGVEVKNLRLAGGPGWRRWTLGVLESQIWCEGRVRPPRWGGLLPPEDGGGGAARCAAIWVAVIGGDEALGSALPPYCGGGVS